jgi:hypothetical protein
LSRKRKNNYGELDAQSNKRGDLMVHWTQRERLRNLDTIRKWTDAAESETIDRDALIHKCVLVLGCTRQKAEEYVKDVLGE